MIIWIYLKIAFCSGDSERKKALHLKVDRINCTTIVPCGSWQPKWFEYKQDGWSCDGSASFTVWLNLMILCISLYFQEKGSTCWAGCWTDLHGQSSATWGPWEAKQAEISPKICGAVQQWNCKPLVLSLGSCAQCHWHQRWPWHSTNNTEHNFPNYTGFRPVPKKTAF